MADHWVPQCYLRNFAIPEDNQQVFLYQRGQRPTPASIRNVATENDLYTFINKETGEKSRDIEKIFSQLEGDAAPILQNISQQRTLGNLSKSDYVTLIQFIAFLATRGPSFTDIQKGLYKETFKLVMEGHAEHPDILREEFKKAGVVFNTEEEFQEMQKSLLDFDKHFKFQITGGKSRFFKQAAETAAEATDMFLNEKDGILLISNSERVFITSDNPVTIQVPPDIPWWLAGGYKYGTIFVPISPQVCFVLRSRPLNRRVIRLRASYVDYINNTIMKGARRQIYANIS